MIAFTLSQEAGFLGGPVFPILFIGGTAGILTHSLLPDIPAALAVAAMIAAVPGGTIGAPVSFILLGAGVVGVGITGIAPVGIAVVTAHLAVWGLTLFKETRDRLQAPTPSAPDGMGIRGAADQRGTTRLLLRSVTCHRPHPTSGRFGRSHSTPR